MPLHWRSLLPREHGSWAYVAVPQIAAAIAVPHPAQVLPWAGGCLLLFLAFQGFASAARRREPFSLPGAIVAFPGIALLALAAREEPGALLAVVPILGPAAMGLILLRGRIARDATMEIAGIAGAAVLGGGGVFVGGGRVDTAAVLAVSVSGYFLAGLIWIRALFAREIPGRLPLLSPSRGRLVGAAAIVAPAIAGVALSLPWAGLLPIAYLPRTAIPIPRRGDGRIRIPLLGAQESVAAGFFAIALGILLRD